MEIVRTVDELRATIAALGGSRDARVGLVPTMGALHEGHLTLVRAAKADCDIVVVSVFVNPTQFNDAKDLEAYPRDEQRDSDLAADAGADVLFAPSAAEMYPEGHSTSLRVVGVSEPLEGAHRGAVHFDGVATVVTKLFIAAEPDFAYFGEKDAQQLAVVKRLVRDLRLRVQIKGVSTVREDSGLAMSSRNVRLSDDERTLALALKRGLETASQIYLDSLDRNGAERAGANAMRAEGVEPEYLALVDEATFAPVESGQSALAVVAAHVGAVRLIDNLHVPIDPERKN
ncbi:pantoate--beta-alanine ligase [Cumulibacter soli]|uniref:pantoate--beta-alanine ligase n=1 Tax=Cumulibacter soli TaxID=2546344 RepID=UPI001067C500|nr:pantoate--beta-alanine ligase [Cumulibacter soli]